MARSSDIWFRVDEQSRRSMDRFSRAVEANAAARRARNSATDLARAAIKVADTAEHSDLYDFGGDEMFRTLRRLADCVLAGTEGRE